MFIIISDLLISKTFKVLYSAIFCFILVVHILLNIKLRELLKSKMRRCNTTHTHSHTPTHIPTHTHNPTSIDLNTSIDRFKRWVLNMHLFYFPKLTQTHILRVKFVYLFFIHFVSFFFCVPIQFKLIHNNNNDNNDNDDYV